MQNQLLEKLMVDKNVYQKYNENKVVEEILCIIQNK